MNSTPTLRRLGDLYSRCIAGYGMLYDRANDPAAWRDVEGCRRLHGRMVILNHRMTRIADAHNRLLWANRGRE